MSGTSVDGIDVAVVDVRGGRLRQKISLQAQGTIAYPAPVRAAVLKVSDAQAHVGDVARLGVVLGELYASAVKAVCRAEGMPLGSIDLIGCHGQTVFHDGAGTMCAGRKVASTLQLGDGSVVAERTGIPVVSDFRTRDIAAGGRGAPLVPYVDYLLFRDPRRGRVALNIGGIANLTAIPAGARSEDVIAFDTGPGNMVVDALAARRSRGRSRYDRDGHMAAAGCVNKALLDELLADPFFRLRPPKTAGREQFGKRFVDHLLSYASPLDDLIATATALTPASVVVGISRFIRRRMKIDELIVSGGGVHNPRMMAYLAAFLPDVAIRTSSDYGVDVDRKEAIAFAVLAHETWRQRPSNLPSATGARSSVILGKCSPA